jgi:tRNA A37 threonylcarbamoyladenosine synthetase subunit TsaC/SUA5/YrdC
MGEHLDAVLDGGELPASPPSTIVDLTGPELRVLREGAVARKIIEKAFAEVETE